MILAPAVQRSIWSRRLTQSWRFLDETAREPRGAAGEHFRMVCVAGFGGQPRELINHSLNEPLQYTDASIVQVAREAIAGL